MNHTRHNDRPKCGPIGVALKVLAYLGVMVGVFGGAFYMQTYQPELMNGFILEVDRFGITSIGQEEKTRRARINALPITYEEKQILINKTVFLGASAEMVKLALGDPREVHKANNDPKQGEGTIYVYHFPKDARPTLLRFEAGRLTHAYKASAIDVATH